MKHTLLTLLLLSFLLPSHGQHPGAVYTREDSITIVKALAAKDATTLQLAQLFMGRPYVAHTLDGDADNERLVVNTRQLDCTTLVETVTALRLCIAQGKSTFADYLQQLEQLRYRNGKRDGYVSRLHYFSDWIRDNERRGWVSEVRVEGMPFTATQRLELNFMSTHPQAYAALRNRPRRIAAIRRQEQDLTGLTYPYIPKRLVGNGELLRSVIRDGDIIAITCNKPGLDIAHLGFAVWKADGLHLLNASQLHHKVVTEPMTLAQYLSRHSSHTGIRVVRVCQ